MRQATLNVLLLGVLIGCGGGNPVPRSVPASGDKPRELAGTASNGNPEWVNRGSLAVNRDGQRAFYGVGLASGIKNPALLRQTSDNRARAEVAKLLEVFSASLMKDYAASTGEQSVEQAVKTAASASLRGVEVVDRYVTADGTLYSLARLDLKRASDLIKQAELSGAAKSHVKKVSTDDIFAQHAKREEPAAPPREQATASASAPPRSKPAAQGPKTQSGARPAWVDGSDSRFPNAQYLCAVGQGPARVPAENASYTALSRIFEVRVSSVSRDFQAAYARTGAASVETQSSESLTQVSTEKVFRGVSLMEVWNGKGEGFFALACLDRAQAARSLSEDITELDVTAERLLQASASLDRASRVSKLGQALDAVQSREALNAELRIVSSEGYGLKSPYAPIDIAAAFEAAVQALKVGVLANGPYASDFRGTLIESLTKRGYEVTDLDQNANSYDVTVSASIRMEDGGKGTGHAASMHFARGVVQVEVKNVQRQRLLTSFRESRKEGHRSREEAERRAVRKLAKKLSKKIGKEIDAALKGRS